MRYFNAIVRHLACFLVANFAFGLFWLAVVLVLEPFGITIVGFLNFCVFVVSIVIAIFAYRYVLRLFARHSSDRVAGKSRDSA